MNDPSDGLPTRRGRQPAIKVQAFLANLPMFSEMSGEELDRVAAGTQAQHATKGDIVFRTGDPCVGFHVVVYGQVKLGFTSPQGVEKVVEIVRPGSSFGEALMFLDKPYIVFAQALADSLLLHVSKRTVLEELARDPGFARRMLSGLSRKLHGLVRDVEAYTLRSGAERVIGYLLRDVPDGQSEGAVEVNLSPGKSVIASRLNMTPEHFSRILHDLAASGLIEVDGRRVHIPDLARLRGSDAPEFPRR
ncbi:MAG TPA: cyclic nucleotide-binding domain-containing protein [Burkholderiales bacterium]|nr:cyclic nucleotide-binding domain-containing protein [Burkholderiales bacterium]